MDEQIRSFLKDEYLKLQDQYEDYDKRSLTIKGWLSAGAAVAIGTALKDEAVAPPLWYALAALSACFWYLEARWKLFQYATRGRIIEIEEYFRGVREPPAPLQMYQKWFDHYRADLRSFTSAALQDFVMLPYALIIVICALGVWATI